MKNNVFGDLLTENPEVARSAFGSHRVITDRWKGMNEQQINDIRKTQAEQVSTRLTLEINTNSKVNKFNQNLVIIVSSNFYINSVSGCYFRQ